MVVFSLAMAILSFLKMSSLASWLIFDFSLVEPPRTSPITARIALHTWITPMGI